MNAKLPDKSDLQISFNNFFAYISQCCRIAIEITFIKMEQITPFIIEPFELIRHIDCRVVTPAKALRTKSTFGPSAPSGSCYRHELIAVIISIDTHPIPLVFWE